ncbi:uncharacterized protein LOC122397272 [Colletes gigas]|uniref:uncharacterized protein LOC122397272 n=1 Tax=Colletes gigas TaxID=935657 RepID=UPI001C9B7FBD|nr:uncharacterized protein LOC122397272 [Colletes gigas]
MLISTAILMTMLVYGSFADQEEEQSSRASRIIPYLHGLKVAQDGGGYELCRPSKFWKEDQLGHVNVFAFLDPSWHYSYRQAIMLELLKNRLEKSNFSNILFFVVAPPLELPEDDLEMKTWKDISKKNLVESELFWAAKETQSDDLGENNGKGSKIIFLQDNRELGIWENFHAYKDEVAVLDRCGRLTYQVIIPWSILYFPYVKAAILSTYKEEPCGPCNEQPPLIRNLMDYEKYRFRNINPNYKEKDENSKSYTKQTLGNLESESVTAFSEESKRTEDDKNASTVIPINFNLNTNDVTITDIAITDIPSVAAEASRTFNGTEHNNGKGDGTFAGNRSESTTETSFITSNLKTIKDYSKIQDHTSMNEHTTTNNNTINGTNTDTKRNDFRQDAINESLKNGDEKEEISSTDYKTSTANIENKEIQVQKDKDLPLRIIMYAPHLHQEDQTIKRYSHLVLKIGTPDYHEHVYNINKDHNQPPLASEKSAVTLEDKKLRKLVSGTNESPGVYGEISDYWRITEDDEFNDRSENLAYSEQDDATTEDTKTNIDNTFDTKTSTLEPSTLDITDSDTNIESSADSDDFMERKLIDHYSKLVPWIYHIL